jgi:hypothetical protein
VDWREIAQHYIDDVAEEINAEEKAEAHAEALEEAEEETRGGGQLWKEPKRGFWGVSRSRGDR